MRAEARRQLSACCPGSHSVWFLQGEPAHFDYLMYPLHSSSITGLDTCIRKPLIATCSLDRSVRIWNYESNSLELYKEYQEEAYAVSLHPSGHFIVVGFADKLCLMNLLIDDIRPFKEYSVRGCRECAFSNGGHLFAAVNGNVIHVFTTTSLENISNLKGHTGKIRSVVWNADDSRLISCGTDGAVYEWSLSSGKRETECVLKSCSYNCVTISPDAKIIFAVGSDHTLKEIADSSILREIPAFDVIYTAIVISHSGRMLFVGTSVGTIRAMKYPLSMQKEFNDYQAHAGPVTKFLLTVSEDGCLFTWRVFDKDGRGIKREREVGFAEEVLVTKTDMEEKVRAGSDEEGCGKSLQAPRRRRALEALCSPAAAGAPLSLQVLSPHPPAAPSLPPSLLPLHPPVILPRGHLVLCAVLHP
ncbi:cilia and flagella associated protein 57 [Phyllostomus discolor]|uniref:Cilia and flagella associated protein 57 n=1 Tax=Phyllostomus discolor TaxID=89673 RepID=A0A834ABD2_9CHIR|nr:cilia and flagella associated protein 57 [Phyllostomus discolor]